MRYYLDGTVFTRLLGDFPETPVLRDWIVAHGRDLVTSILSRWEAVEEIAMGGQGQRAQARELLGSVTEIPISGKALEVGSYAVAAVNAHTALHVGIAAADQAINVVVTYDNEVATASRLYGLDVHTPGRANDWYVS